MTIRDSFLAFADKNHLPVKEKQENGTSIFSFQISGEKGKYGAYAMCLEDERMLTFFVDCNIRVEESQRKILWRIISKLLLKFWKPCCRDIGSGSAEWSVALKNRKRHWNICNVLQT